MKTSNGVKKTALTFFLFIILIFAPFSQVMAGGSGCPTEGLVPCGTEGCPCELCDFFVMFERIVNFILFEIVPVLAVLMIAIGGFMLLFAHSGGGSEMVSRAKKLFTSVAIGLLLIYGAWVIVNTFFGIIGVASWTGLKNGWWKIKCETPENTWNYNLPETGAVTGADAGTETEAETGTGIGQIIDINQEVRGNELYLKVTIKNTSDLSKKFRVVLLTGNGRLVDTEPYSSWKGVATGGKTTLPLSAAWNLEWTDVDKGGNYSVELREQSAGTVDTQKGFMPSPY